MSNDAPASVTLISSTLSSTEEALTTAVLNHSALANSNVDPTKVNLSPLPINAKGGDADGNTIKIPASITATSEITTSTDGHLTTIAITTVIPNPSALPTPRSTSSADSKSPRTIIGAVAGFILGLILVLALTVFLIRRRRRSRKRFDLLEEEQGGPSGRVVTIGTRSMPGPSSLTATREISSSEEMRGAMVVTPFHFLTTNTPSPQITAPSPGMNNPRARPPSFHVTGPLEDPVMAPMEIHSRIAAARSSPQITGLRPARDISDQAGDRANGKTAPLNGEALPELLPASGDASSPPNIELIAARVAEILSAQERGRDDVPRPPDTLRLDSNVRAQGPHRGMPRAELARPVSGGRSSVSTAPPMYEE